MGRVDLAPFPANPQALASAFQINFQRIKDAIESLGQFEQGTVDVTGTLIIDTGIAQVFNGFAVLNDAPVAGGCFIRVTPTANRREIQIQVYKSDFTLSVIPVTINWFALGEN